MVYAELGYLPDSPKPDLPKLGLGFRVRLRVRVSG